MDLKEGKISPLIIDFGEIRDNDDVLNESFIRMFGSFLENILGVMFSGGSMPVTVRGTNPEVKSFIDVIKREKRYFDSYKKFGLHNPSTYRDKYKLNRAVENFEKATGLIYPIH